MVMALMFFIWITEKLSIVYIKGCWNSKNIGSAQQIAKMDPELS